MFGKLMPKEGKYFDHFNNHAALIAKGGQLLTELITALANNSGDVTRLADEIDQVDAFLEAGAEHLILATHTSDGRPYDLAPLERLLAAAG